MGLKMSYFFEFFSDLAYSRDILVYSIIIKKENLFPVGLLQAVANRT